MGIWTSIITIVFLCGVALVGTETLKMHYFFGIVIPYIAIAAFLFGVIYRIIKWARSPVPFRITTTTGQQKSHKWLKQSKLDNPSSTLGVIGRMALEILFFRSLFRNTRAGLKDGKKLVYGAEKWLWALSLAFHWSFLIIVLRHFRFFTEPVPAFVPFLQTFDGFFQLGVPIIYMTDVAIIAGLTFLYFRRVFDRKVKYMSLLSDYFPLLLIGGIAITGILMRYFIKVDLISIKELTVGLLSFQPVLPSGISSLFYLHLFLVSTLIAYFPMSKLVHAPGIFLSPTRNLANTSRMKRHVNPWNYPVLTHTYEEYEEEFRPFMKGAGLPLEKEES